MVHPDTTFQLTGASVVLNDRYAEPIITRRRDLNGMLQLKTNDRLGETAARWRSLVPGPDQREAQFNCGKVVASGGL